MYKKILVPLDGSEFGECSLFHVKTIAANCGTEKIILLTAIEHREENAIRAWMGEDFVIESYKRARKQAEDYLDKIKNELGYLKIKIEKVIEDGWAADIIIEYAKKEDVDLIILSTHGKSGIVKWTLGSVADKVIRHSIAPVLLVAPTACRI